MTDVRRDLILKNLRETQVATISTRGRDSIRSRLMHFAVDEDFNFYLASMKGDPKIDQMTKDPTVGLLVFNRSGDMYEWSETEIEGNVSILKEEKERTKAERLLKEVSPVVKGMVESGAGNMLEYLIVKPKRIQFRIFGEIVKGKVPDVIEFQTENKNTVAKDIVDIKKILHQFKSALRLPFLTATILPVVTGALLYFHETGNLNWFYFILSLVGASFLHLSVNLFNDYFDHLNGCDEENKEFIRPFTGGSRAIQSGIFRPSIILLWAIVFLLGGSLIGLYFLYVVGFKLLWIGLIAIFSVLFYVNRRFSLASIGLGELAVFLNFGPLAVLGSYLVQSGRFSFEAILVSLPLGFLITAVLYANEFPDYVADKKTGKWNLVVRLGRIRAKWGYLLLIAASYASVLYLVGNGILPKYALIILVTLPISFFAIKVLFRYHEDTAKLAPALAATVILHLVIGYLIAISLLFRDNINILMIVLYAVGVLFTIKKGIELVRAMSGILTVHSS